MARLHGYAYATQAQGYPKGVPANFQPIIACFKNEDGSINRQRMLDGPEFSEITGVERTNLLKPA